MNKSINGPKIQHGNLELASTLLSYFKRNVSICFRHLSAPLKNGKDIEISTLISGIWLLFILAAIFYLPNNKLYTYNGLLTHYETKRKLFQNNANIFLVSLIIANCNKGHYLHRLFDGLFNQIGLVDQYHELVFVDDGSTDNSFQYIWNHSSFFNQNNNKVFFEENNNQVKFSSKRIKYCRHNYNKGLLNARRTGIMNSNGEYILHIDSDDKILNSTVSNIIRSLKENNYPDMAWIDVQHVKFDERNKIIHYDFYQCKKNYSNDLNCDSQKWNKKKRSELLDTIETFAISWNVFSNVVKRSLYQKCYSYIFPLMESKRFIWSEDKLQAIFLFAFAKRLVCAKIKSYFYYAINGDGAFSEKYQPKKMNNIQGEFTREVFAHMREFYGICDVMNNPEEFWKKFFEVKKRSEIYFHIKKVQNNSLFFKCERNEGEDKSHFYFDDKSDDVCIISNYKFP